jgi:predicted metal-binding protein
MADQTMLQKVFHDHGCRDFRWIDPGEIILANWVRMKCTFGCDSFGRNASCPPNTPTIAECREFFREYRLGVIFRFRSKLQEPEDRHAWARKINMELLDLEREIYIAGYYKTFLLFMDSCNLCRECAKSRHICRNRKLARPSPEGMGVDVFATVSRFGFPLEVLPDYNCEMNCYSFLLIE